MSYDPSQHPKDKVGRWTDKNGSNRPGSLPEETTTEIDESYDQLLAAASAFEDPYEARRIEFDLPDGSMIRGYSYPWGNTRIARNAVPDGWRAYSVIENDHVYNQGRPTVSIMKWMHDNQVGPWDKQYPITGVGGKRIGDKKWSKR